MAHETTTDDVVQSTELVIPNSLPVVVEPASIIVKPRGLPPAAWALFGIGVGVVGTVLAMSARQEPKTQLVAKANPPMATSPGHGLTPPPPSGQTSSTTQQGSGAQALANPGSVIKDAPEAPMNPFGGSSFVLPKLPNSSGRASAGTGGMKGFILPKTLPVLPATGMTMRFGSPISVPAAGASTKGSSILNNLAGSKLPKPPAALKAPSLFKGGNPSSNPTKAAEQSTLVTVSQTTKDRQGAVDDVTLFAQKLGGKAQPLTEQGSDGKPEIKGVLVTLPEASVNDLLKHLADAGAVVDKQTWSGPSSERKAKLAEDAESRVASLKKLREALLVTYAEDAQPVKDVDDEIAKANKSLEQFQTDKGSEKMAIVRISFVRA